MKNEFYFARLLSLIKQKGWQALLIAPSEDMEFLFGGKTYLCERFQGIFILPDGRCFVICNLLSVAEYRQLLGDDIPIYPWSDMGGFLSVTRQAFADYALCNGTIAVNAAVRAFHMALIAPAVGIKLESAPAVLQEIRICKTEREQAALRRSSLLADQAFLEIQRYIKPGVSELELQAQFARIFRAGGASSSYCLVASGAGGAMPHYAATEKLLAHGDAVILDFGGVVDGMCSDMTRTVFIGEASDFQRHIYDIVLRANLAAEDKAGIGAYIPEVDQAARGLIEREGYGAYFPMRLGHGIGYSVHEAPDIKQSNRRNLEAGMSFTIEPGIYLPGQFGVRIEDVVLVTEQGTEILNQASKQLVVLA